jgi:hypothetical protein
VHTVSDDELDLGRSKLAAGITILVDEWYGAGGWWGTWRPAPHD